MPEAHAVRQNTGKPTNAPVTGRFSRRNPMKLLSCLLLGLMSSIAFAANPQVEIKTNQGPIVLELYPDKAPKTVENFLQYVKEDHYRQTIFHRVIKEYSRLY